MKFIAALSFLTRLPLPARWLMGITPEMYAQSTPLFPLVGVIIGALSALLGWATTAGAGFSGQTGAAAVITFWVWITGGLHLDGLIDTADGWGAAPDREKMLQVMRDSRVGAMGVVAAVVALLWQFVLLSQLMGGTYPGNYWTAVLLLAPVWSRWAMALVVAAFPYARQEGLGAIFRAGPGPVIGWASVWAVTVTAATYFWLRPALMILIGMAAAAGVTALWLAQRWTRLLGGLTGDIYGAINEITGLVILAVAVVFGGMAG